MSTRGELTAFCAMCPSPEAVAGLLVQFGLTLTYARPAEIVQEYLHLPPLPAQYHFEDRWGTQVQFLAGPDTLLLADDEGEDSALQAGYTGYPLHASRFWLTPGGNELATRRVLDVLADRWGLCWQDLHEKQLIEEVA